MEDYVRALDEYFCAQYANYTKISAIEGYEMPEVVYVGADGNIQRHDNEVMRLCHQKKADELLKRLKQNMEDTEFTFNFRFRSLRERTADCFHKVTFRKLFSEALARVKETPQSVGEKLSVSPAIWSKIVKGKVYPEKNTVIAAALVSGMQQDDLNALFNLLGFSLSHDNVRDVVCEYLLKHAVFNEEMQRRCLKEYKITSLPIKD